jgi:ATP-dependent DNA helicase RecQ
MSGGYEAAISEIDEDGALAQIVGSAAAVRLHWGQHISLIDGRSGTLVRSSPNGPDPVNAELVTRLKEWRRATATQKGMPAYVILHDSSIMELASRRPTTERALLEITGIGPGKVESYGEDLLALLEL